MSALGDVLERLADDREPAPSVHASVDEWCDPDVADEALGRLAGKVPAVIRVASDLAALPGRVLRRGRPDKGVTYLDQSSLEVWLAEDGRARVERRWMDAGGPRHLVTTGRIDDRPWAEQCVDVATGAVADRKVQGRPSLDTASHRFSKAGVRDLLATLDLEPGEPVEIAGRSAVEAVATARADHGPWPHWLPAGADRWNLTLDLEFGHLLTVEGSLDGRPFGRQTTTSITYGADLDPGLFTLPG